MSIPYGGPLHRIPSTKPGGGITLAADHAAVTEGRTLFPSRVVWAEDTLRLLKSGMNQRKIGAKIVKGRWRGFPVYCLTLEERATCPSQCEHWRSCYGNNMHRAERIANDRLFEDVLWDELEELQQRHPGGFAVRLHVLGDFYSFAYVDLWRRALDAFPALHCFGFTRRWAADGDTIGWILLGMVRDHWDRFAIRFSGVEAPFGATSFEKGEAPAGIPCPAQSGKTDCCGTCALCWTTTKPIAFEQHSGNRRGPAAKVDLHLSPEVT